MELRFVDQTDAALAKLSAELDDYYFAQFGALALQYHSHNALQGFAGVVLAVQDGAAVGCCGWKPLDAVTAEIKRVYVRADCRRQGAARAMLAATEAHAAASGCHRAVLETAAETPEAVAFYRACGYKVLPEGYGAYVGDANCICLQKQLMKP